MADFEYVVNKSGKISMYIMPLRGNRAKKLARF